MNPNHFTRRDSHAETSHEIRIVRYEAAMLEQVIDLFCENYGFDTEPTEQAFTQFYEHPLQREKAIRIVALDGDRVAGFQSFFSGPTTSTAGGSTRINPGDRWSRPITAAEGYSHACWTISTSTKRTMRSTF